MLASGVNSGLAAVDAELAVDRLAVRLDGVERHVQLAGDLTLRHLRRQVAQHGEFAVGDLIDEPWLGRSSIGEPVTGLDACQRRADDAGLGAPVDGCPGRREADRARPGRRARRPCRRRCAWAYPNVNGSGARRASSMARSAAAARRSGSDVVRARMAWETDSWGDSVSPWPSACSRLADACSAAAVRLPDSNSTTAARPGATVAA